jgi:hypothetical protein
MSSHSFRGVDAADAEVDPEVEEGSSVPTHRLSLLRTKRADSGVTGNRTVVAFSSTPSALSTTK